MIDNELLARLLVDLVGIESVNPDLVPGGRGEAAIARYVADFLRDAGFEARLQEAAPSRFNALGVLHGKGKGPSLMLNGHLDTVGVAGMEDPFAARIEGDRLFGRGAHCSQTGKRSGKPYRYALTNVSRAPCSLQYSSTLHVPSTLTLWNPSGSFQLSGTNVRPAK